MNLDRLLNQVSKISKESKELSILKGENFNVFKIFDMERDENKMHSRFIQTLINPKGDHERGTIFLELFLEVLNKADYFEDINAVNTKVEHDIGRIFINDDQSTGGRIDIYIWDASKSISIENKIYAGDQEKQLVRYINYNPDSNDVFYLNLFGNEPDGDFATGKYKSDLNEGVDRPDFYCISYSETILSWLEKCQKEASDFPIIRETIKQYIITIKRLTGQLINQKMDQDIKNLIKRNFESANLIAKNIDEVKKEVVNEFLLDLKEYLISELGQEFRVEKENISNKWAKFKVRNKKWLSDAWVTLEGQSLFWKNESIIGINAKRDSDLRKNLQEVLKESEDIIDIKQKYSRKSEWWYFYGPVFNFSIENQFVSLLEVNSKKELVKQVGLEIIDLVNQLNSNLIDEK